MSDYFISIAPRKVNFSDSKEIAERIKDWLITQKIIQPTPVEGSFRNYGYPPGLNFQEILTEKDEHLVQIKPNGVEIISERHVFHNGGYELDHISCPNCKYDILELDWTAAISGWLDGNEKKLFECPNCKQVSSITEYEFYPEWGFSNVGLTFWNWLKLKDEFIETVENIIGEEVMVIYGKI